MSPPLSIKKRTAKSSKKNHSYVDTAIRADWYGLHSSAFLQVSADILCIIKYIATSK